eukprot:5402136-Amphidinium_carterae.1
MAAGAVWNTDSSTVSYFIQRTLPFGARASVAAFNRCSRSLWAIGVTWCRMPWLNYFDDYPVVLPEALSHVAGLMVE